MDGYWSAQDCYARKPFVCAIANTLTPTPPPTHYVNCSLGWTYFEPTQSCYGGIYGNFTNWDIAQTSCVKLGGNLPSIHSYSELVFLNSLVSAFFKTFLSYFLRLCFNISRITMDWFIFNR